MKNMIDLKPHIIDGTMQEIQTVSNGLLSIIIRCLLAAKEYTGIGFADMTSSKKQTQEISDAKHLAALLLFDETIQMSFTRKQVCEVFGLATSAGLRQAEQKRRYQVIFRRKYEALRKEYENTVLIEYNQEIPF